MEDPQEDLVMEDPQEDLVMEDLQEDLPNLTEVAQWEEVMEELLKEVAQEVMVANKCQEDMEAVLVEALDIHLLLEEVLKEVEEVLEKTLLPTLEVDTKSSNGLSVLTTVTSTSNSRS